MNNRNENSNVIITGKVIFAAGKGWTWEIVTTDGKVVPENEFSSRSLAIENMNKALRQIAATRGAIR